MIRPVRLIGAAIAAGLAIPGTAPAAAAPAAPRPVACPMKLAPELAGRVQCFELQVPQDRSRPEGLRLTLGYAVLTPASGARSPEPLLFLVGGNGAGQRALTVRSAFIEGIAGGRSVILPDHRGSGWSRPPLHCKGFDGSNAEDAFLEASPSPALARARDRCLSELRAKGVDPDRFHAADAAADLVDLRRALGIARWNLFGGSYGTEWGQQLLRLDGDAVRAVVFEGATAIGHGFGPDHVLRPLADAFAECAAQPDCAAAYPDLAGDLDRAVRRLGADPAPPEFLETLARGLAFEEGRTLVPRAVAAGARGDLGPWRAVSAVLPPEREPPLPDPSLISPLTDCWDVTVPRAPAPPSGFTPAVDSAASALRSPYAASEANCRAFGIRPRTAAAYVRAPAAAPALVVSGLMDPWTPPAHGALAAAALPNARHVVIPRAAHGTFRYQPACVTAVIGGFFADPARPPDLACVAAIGPTRYQLP